MKIIFTGLALICAAIYIILPTTIPFSVIGWTEDFFAALRGIIPLGLILIGFITIIIGYADIRDTHEAKKEASDLKKTDQ